MNDLYIYYRVRQEHAAQLAARVHAMQRQLATGQVKRRPGASDGRQTWMEIYTATTPAFAGVLEQAVAAAGLLELTDGPRHTEIFTELASCA